MKNLSAATAIALALSAGSAFAADLPSRKAPPVYVEPAPVFTWTGLYAGVNVGYGWADPRNLYGREYFGGVPTGLAWNYGGPSIDGVLGGGQFGYNYQFAGTGFVVGIEADIQAADLTKTSAGFGNNIGYFPYLSTRQTIDWFGTVRGRLGYAVLPTLLVYGTGGFAYGGGSSRFTYFDSANFSAFASESNDTRTGWAAGGGVEWAFLPNWSAKVEYLYVDLGRSRGFWTNEFTPAGALSAFSVNQVGASNRFHSVKVGLNYHFNLFGSAGPVLAKY